MCSMSCSKNAGYRLHKPDWSTTIIVDLLRLNSNHIMDEESVPRSSHAEVEYFIFSIQCLMEVQMQKQGRHE